MWHSHESNFTAIAQITLLYNEPENNTFKSTGTSTRSQWVNVHQVTLCWFFFFFFFLSYNHDYENGMPFICKMYSFTGIEIAWMPLFSECTHQVSSWIGKEQTELVSLTYYHYYVEYDHLFVKQTVRSMIESIFYILCINVIHHIYILFSADYWTKCHT